MTTDEALKLLRIGTVQELADTLSISRAAVYLWNGQVPRLREYEIREIVERRGRKARSK